MIELTPEEFKSMREKLGYSQQALADEWGMGDSGGRTIRRWESGDRPVNSIAAYAIETMWANGLYYSGNQMW